MNIPADAVKTLRARTGAGMMECKKALVETDGDLDAAAEIMRKAGLAKADRKAARIAAEGVIAAAQSADGHSATLVEVNCETDFVARQAEFQAFAAAVAEAALQAGVPTADAAAALPLAAGATVDAARRDLIARLGENITVRRLGRVQAPSIVGSYVHGTRIGTLVGVEGGHATLARDLAMHVAAANPQFLSPAEVPAATLSKEREILAAQAAAEGKAAGVIERVVEGRLRKYLGEICLSGQPFVKDPDRTVGELLQAAGASVSAFLRFEVGEGIDKRPENFAQEVLAQVKAAGAGS